MSEPAETPPVFERPALSATDWPDWNDWRINPPLPVQGRERFALTLNEFSGEQAWNPFERAAQFDALAEHYSASLGQALLQDAKPILPALCMRLKETDSLQVLRNVAAWAGFRYVLGAKHRQARYHTWDVAGCASLNEENPTPFAGRRLYLISAVLASALASGQQSQMELARTLCRHFIGKQKLTGHWAPIFDVIATEGAGPATWSSGGRFPYLFEARGYLTDSARVRLKLFWLHHQCPINVVRLINATAHMPSISWQIKSREIRRFLDARRALGKPVAPLRQRHIEWLRERELRLVVRRPELFDALCHNSDATCNDVTCNDTSASAPQHPPTPQSRDIMRQHAATLLELLPVAQGYLRRLRRAINIRHWPIASECIADLQRLNPPRRWIYLELRFAGCDPKGRRAEVPDMDEGRYSERKWAPMPKAHHDWLASQVSARVLQNMEIGIPPWLDVAEATRQFIAKTLASDKVTPLEMQLLFNAMTDEQWRIIDQARRTDLLTDSGPLWHAYDLDRALLLSARSDKGRAIVLHRAGHERYITPLIRNMAIAQAQGRYEPAATGMLKAILHYRSDNGKASAQPWYLPFIGLPEWRAIERHFDEVQPVLTDALTHVQAKGRIFDPRGYFKRLVEWNTVIGQVFPANLFDTWCELARLPAEKAFERLPAEQARALLADIDQCPSLLGKLHELRHGDLTSDILAARAWRTHDEDALWRLLTSRDWKYRPHKDSKSPRVPAHLLPSFLASVTPSVSTALPASATLPAPAALQLHIAFLRQDPHGLKHLLKAGTPQDIEHALWCAAEKLAGTHPRDAAFLQMLALLGADTAAQLAALLHTAKPDRTQFGHALDDLYRDKEIPKRNGKIRILRIPDALLKHVQKRIAQRVLKHLGAHANATGFVDGLSIADNALPHVHQPVVASCDIKNCFPGVPARAVWRALERDLAGFNGHTVSPIAIRWLAQLCCAHGGLPIGAPTSPALLNRVLFDVDAALAGKAASMQCRYTRYADDLCFSGPDDCIKLIGHAARLLRRFSLELDPDKTNVFRRGRRQMVTGLCVNDGINIPRARRRLLRAALHRAKAIEAAQSRGIATDALPTPTLNGKELNAHMLQGHVAWQAFIRRKRDASGQ